MKTFDELLDELEGDRVWGALKVVKTLHSPVEVCINGQVRHTICKTCSGDEAVDAIEKMSFFEWFQKSSGRTVEWPCRTIINVAATLGVSPE